MRSSKLKERMAGKRALLKACETGGVAESGSRAHQPFASQERRPGARGGVAGKPSFVGNAPASSLAKYVGACSHLFELLLRPPPCLRNAWPCGRNS